MKIVINSTHSYLANTPPLLANYAKQLNKTIYFYKVKDWNTTIFNRKYKKIDIEKLKDKNNIDDWDTFDVVNSFINFGDEVHINELFKENNLLHLFRIERNDPNLIKAVEETSEIDRNGLCIIEIPDDVKWYIDESEAGEFVAEQHKSWYADGRYDEEQ